MAGLFGASPAQGWSTERRSHRKEKPQKGGTTEMRSKQNEEPKK